MRARTITRTVVAAFVVALLVPLAALGGGGHRGIAIDQSRLLYATDNAGNLLRFREHSPWLVGARPITGLPTGVSLKGIDFRPATGDLYALGSDRVVYRVNPATAIAVAEGPAFEAAPTALTGDRIGFDFNPTVDKIRVTSDADDNLRLDPDLGSLLSNDTRLTPADVTVVGSAYTNSSFVVFANRPATTMLFAYDTSGSGDRLWLQNPANAGTLTNPLATGIDLGSDVGFDIAGTDNRGYVAGASARRAGGRSYTASTWRPARRGRSAASATVTSS